MELRDSFELAGSSQSQAVLFTANKMVDADSSFVVIGENTNKSPKKGTTRKQRQLERLVNVICF